MSTKPTAAPTYTAAHAETPRQPSWSFKALLASSPVLVATSPPASIASRPSAMAPHASRSADSPASAC
eukprot:2589718-Prymnesium_polylepis.1